MRSAALLTYALLAAPALGACERDPVPLSLRQKPPTTLANASVTNAATAAECPCAATVGK